MREIADSVLTGGRPWDAGWNVRRSTCVYETSGVLRTGGESGVGCCRGVLGGLLLVATLASPGWVVPAGATVAHVDGSLSASERNETDYPGFLLTCLLTLCRDLQGFRLSR